MNPETKTLVRARATVIRDALTAARIEPDQLTTAALLYLVMQMLNLNGDQLIDNLPDSIRASAAALAKTRLSLDPSNPETPITLTQLELATLLASKLGSC